MEILSLNLKAYGPFTDAVLDLSATPRQLHVVYGPNEAGKSSTLRALHDMLYGIPHQTPENFRHPYDKLRLGATLRHGDGSEFTFVRRKGIKSVLRDADDRDPVEPDLLARYLGHVNQDLFRLLFAIDYEQLVEGGRAILSGEGDLGESLFISGTGLSRLREVQAQFQKTADELFVERGTVRPVNANFTRWKELQSRIRTLQLSQDHYTERLTRLERDEAELADLTAALERDSADMHRLERIVSVVQDVADYVDCQIGRESIGDVPHLPEDFSTERHRAETSLHVLKQKAVGVAADKERLEQSLDSLLVDERLLAAADRIAVLVDERGAHRKAVSDTGDRELEREQLRQDVDRLCRDLDEHASAENVDRFRLTTAQKTRIRTLAQDRGPIEDRLASLRTREETLTLREGELRDRLKALPEAGQADRLRDAVETVVAQGSLVEQEAALESARRSLVEERDQLLRRLGVSGEVFSELRDALLPASEFVDRAVDVLADLDMKIAHAVDDVESAEDRSREAQRELARLKRDSDLPSLEELQDARDARRVLWERVRQRWFTPPEKTGKADRSAQLDFGADPDDEDLAKAYEQSVRHADDLADRLRRGAEQAAALEVATRQTDGCTAELEDRREHLARLRERRAEEVTEWESHWEGTGVPVRSPAAMRVWLADFSSAEQVDDDLRSNEARRQQFVASLAQFASNLRTASAVEGSDEVTSATELMALLDDARGRIKAEAQLEEQRRDLRRDLERIGDELPEVRAERTLEQERLTAWRADWTSALEPLGLPDRLEPAEAEAVLSTTEDLFRTLDRIASLDERIAGMRSDAEAFTARVASLTAEIAPELGNLDPVEIVGELDRHLNEMRAVHRRRSDAEVRLAELTTEADRVQRDHSEAEAVLQRLCQVAGCDDPSDLPEQERLSAEARRLDERLAQLRSSIVQRSGGRPFEEFAEEVRSVNADELPACIQRLSASIKERKDDERALIASVAEQRNDLARIDGSEAAAVARQELETLRAELEDQLATYRDATLTVALLKRATERYRERHQGAVLHRASDLFAQLTCDSFSSLAVDYDDNGDPELVGVRPDRSTTKVVGMSEGSCDQLYLAIRLASLENYFRSHEVLPFVVDDILVNFDDERSAAALRCLAELGQTTQVIFFTHHQHLVDLATEHLDADAWSLHHVPPHSAS